MSKSHRSRVLYYCSRVALTAVWVQSISVASFPRVVCPGFGCDVFSIKALPNVNAIRVQVPYFTLSAMRTA
jgi:hypothetical protein